MVLAFFVVFLCREFIIMRIIFDVMGEIILIGFVFLVSGIGRSARYSS